MTPFKKAIFVFVLRFDSVRAMCSFIRLFVAGHFS